MFFDEALKVRLGRVWIGKKTRIEVGRAAGITEPISDSLSKHFASDVSPRLIGSQSAKEPKTCLSGHVESEEPLKRGRDLGVQGLKGPERGKGRREIGHFTALTATPCDVPKLLNPIGVA